MLHAGVSETLAEDRTIGFPREGLTSEMFLRIVKRAIGQKEESPFKMPKMFPWSKERVMQPVSFEY